MRFSTGVVIGVSVAAGFLSPFLLFRKKQGDPTSRTQREREETPLALLDRYRDRPTSPEALPPEALSPEEAVSQLERLRDGHPSPSSPRDHSKYRIPPLLDPKFQEARKRFQDEMDRLAEEARRERIEFLTPVVEMGFALATLSFQQGMSESAQRDFGIYLRDHRPGFTGSSLRNNARGTFHFNPETLEGYVEEEDGSTYPIPVDPERLDERVRELTEIYHAWQTRESR